MFGLETLDVLIGLATIYLIFGIACTAAVEALTSWLKIRSTHLQAALSELLAGEHRSAKSFVAEFYAHPLVQCLSQGEHGRPSYIPSEIVARVVESVLMTNSGNKSLPDMIAALPGSVETNRLKGLFDALLKQANGDADTFRHAVESQFNAVMDRASGWYKRYTQNVALVVATVFVLGANLDTIEMASTLASSPDTRLKLVEMAGRQWADVRISDNTASTKKAAENARKSYFQATEQLKANGFQLGWKHYPTTLVDIISKVAGLLVSIVAISLGAPFWFSVLQRFMQVRATGVAPRI